MRHPVLMAAASLMLIAAGPAKPTPTSSSKGDAKDKEPTKKEAEKPVPKVTSVSPAFAVKDSSDYQVTLRGTNLKGTGLKIRFETDPSQGLNTCDLIGEATDTEVTCKLKATDVSVGEPYHFSITWKKDNEVVVGAASTATFTVRDPLAATAMCLVLRAEEVQVRVRAAGVDKDTTVQFTTSNNKYTCMDPTVVGDEDVVCFLPTGVASDIGKDAWVQLLRKNEHQIASAKTASKLPSTPDLAKANTLYDVQGCFALTR